ncbi:MAG: hypothetical protein AAGB02_05095 [Pseudomonadota bacterium]
MNSTLKKWTGLGLGAAFIGTGLAGCAPSAEKEEEPGQVETSTQNPETPTVVENDVGERGIGEGGEGGEGEGGEAGHSMESLPLPNRLAFMTGHVEAGLALYRAGAPEMAAPHLLHPVSETHQSERSGLDALGFDASIFEAVSEALENGTPANEVEPQLEAAEENLAMLATKAGGDPNEIIRFLMDVIVAEYTVAINDGTVTDPGEYQDAYGFAVVALDHARSMTTTQPVLESEITKLLAMWPDGALPSPEPTPVGQIVAQTSNVLFALPQE